MSGSGKAKGEKALLQERLYPMPPLHQLDTIYFQLLRQMQAGRSFDKALEHQDHEAAGPANAFEDGVSEQIVDRSTDVAAIIHHWSAMAVMRLLPFW